LRFRTPHPRGPSKIKVLYLIGTLDIGGTERQLVQIAKGLDRESFEPVVVCLSKGGPLQEDLARFGVPVKIVGLRSLRQIWHGPISLGRLVRIIGKERPDIVHGFLFWAYVLGAYAARLAGVPVVVASRRSLGIYKRDKPHYLALEGLANRLTDLIVANSDAVRSDVLEQEHLAARKVVVIHNGVPTSGAGGVDIERASVGAGPGSLVVGVLANLIPYKGHDFFLEAWQIVAPRFPSALALLIGEGPARGAIEERTRELGLERSVRLLGSRADSAALLGMVDLVVHPSHQEGFSNAILEAMAAAKPVVATNVGGNPEAVLDGVTGLLVPPNDSAALASAIIRLLGDPAARQMFGRAGRDRIQDNFTLDRMIGRYEALYRDLVGAKIGR
jgi:glycosyltransferase involved in cell wall biosynthesis